MIINGGSRAGAKSLATHLLNAKKNEHVSVLEVRGCLSTDLRGALREMEESAEATRCQKALYHANIDPDRNVKMTPEQWQRSIDALEKKLGLTDQPRAVVMHEKHGREHVHVVWNRIDLDKMLAVRDSHNYRKHEEVARELEREFGHERVQGVHVEREGVERPERTPPKWQMQQAERLQTADPREIKAQVQELWQKADSGKSFAAALEDQGFTLAKGDRRDFVVIDQAGGVHSLGRCTGVKAAELRERMSGVDREALPGVQQAVEAVRQRGEHWRGGDAYQDDLAWHDAVAKAGIEKEKIERRFVEPAPAPAAIAQQPERKPNQTVADIRQSRELSDSAAAFVAALDQRGIRLARVTLEEASVTRDKHEAAMLKGSYAPEYRAGEIVAINQRGHVYQLTQRTTGENRAAFETFLNPLDRGQLQGIEATRVDIDREAKAQKALEPQRDLSETAADIRLARGLSQSAAGFEQGLNDRGIHLAVVTVEEAKLSHADHLAAQQCGAYSPILREGEIVAVNPLGRVYTLNFQTTGESRAENDKFLATLDRGQLQGVEATQLDLAMCGEAFATLSQVATLERSKLEIGLIDLAGDTLKAGVAELAGGIGGIVEGASEGLKMFTGMLGGFAALFGAGEPAPPQTKEEALGRREDRLEQIERILANREYKSTFEANKKTHEREIADRQREDDDERGRSRQRY